MKEALKLALEALEPDVYRAEWAVEQDREKAITAIKAALAQPTSGDYAHGYVEGFNDACMPKPAQQEPVAFLVDDDLYYPEEIDWETLQEQGHTVAALYTTPPQQEPVAMKFKIYKPTVPDPMRQGINNALLPWVYDQDRSSGFDASMWVTPVATLPPQRPWVGLTEEEVEQLADGCCPRIYWQAIEAKLKEKNT